MSHILRPQPYPTPADVSDPTLVGAWCQSRASSALQDASSAGNDMTLYGASVLERDGAWKGDGATGYLRRAVANFRSADLAGTFEIWFKRTTYGAPTCAYFCSTDEASATDRFAVYLTSNVFWVRSCSSGTMIPDGFTGTDNEFSTPSTLSAGIWMYGVVTSTGSAYHMYIDGAEVSTSWHSGANNGQWIGRVLNRDCVAIGADTSDSGTTHYNNDQLACVAMYSEAKSASWVAEQFRRGVPDSSLVLWIPYGDSDYSRYCRTLTVNGNPIRGGDGMAFDGTGDYILAGTDPLYGVSATEMSCSFWLYTDPASFDGTAKVIVDTSTSNPNGNNGFYIALDDRGTGSPLNGIQFVIKAATTYGNYKSADNALGTNGTPRWVHVVCTYSAGAGKVYINGVDSTTVVQAGVGNYVPRDANLAIGADNGGSLPGTCKIRNLRLNSRAISAGEVANLYVQERGDL